MSELPVMIALGDDYPELREAVHKICERYPGEDWRKLEAEQAYPTEFITELTQGGSSLRCFRKNMAVRDCPCAPPRRLSISRTSYPLLG